MKVLFNTHPLRFQNPGGGEVIIKELYQGLRDKGVDVKLFDPWNDKIDKFDIIHEFHCLQWENWFYYKKSCQKLLVTPTHWPQSTYYKKFKFHLKDKLNNLRGKELSQRNAMLMPDLYLSTTKMEIDNIQRFYKLDLRSDVIYNGVHVPLEKPNLNYWKNKLQINEYALFVGNISPVKNLHTLIEAFNFTDENLVIVGGYSVEYRAYFERCKKIAQKNIHFIGPLQHNSKELNDIYYGASFVIVPSLFETCSLVGLEAGIRGIPVVMTSQGATKEIYRDKVTYCDPHQVESIIESMGQVKRGGGDNTLQEFVTKHYSWDKIIDKLIGVYDAAMKK